MRFGLKEQTIKAINAVLRSYSEVDKAILYGSRAMGNYRENSDIDLVLLGDQIDFTLFTKIVNDLDDLAIPYKIDLSLLRDIQNQDLLKHIQKVGIEFYHGQDT
jgi:uncharacterized protein